MLFRSKLLRVLLFAVPLVLVALLWKAARKRPSQIALPAPIAALALSHDGRRLAVVTEGGQVMWRENGGFHVLPVEQPFSFQNSPAIQFSRDSKTLIGTGFPFKDFNTTGAYQWDLTSNKIVWSASPLIKNTHRIFSISSDGRKLLDRSYDVIKVLDTTKKGEPSKNALSLYAVSFPTENRFQIKIVLKDGGETVPQEVVLSSDNKTLIISGMDGRLQFYDLASGKRIERTPAMPKPSANYLADLSQLKPSPDDRFVALCSELGVFVWDKKANRWTQGPQTTPTEHYVAWMPDSRSLWLGSNVSTGEDKNSTRQLSVPALKTMRVLPEWGPLALSGDGRTLATGTSSSTPSHVRLWPLD